MVVVSRLIQEDCGSHMAEEDKGLPEVGMGVVDKHLH